MRILIFLTAFLAVQIASGCAPNTRTAYADDLATIYGDIQQVKAWVEVCSAEFPPTKVANRNALSRWQQQYQSFIQEIEKRWAQWITDESNGDPARKEELLAKFQRLYEDTKNDFRQKLISDGYDLFLKRYENYTQYLKSPKMSLERVHAERVKRIRLGSTN